MLRLPQNHPERFILAEEIHARPPEALSTPGRATYLAVIVEPENRDAERQHIATLCEHFGVAGPSSSATHLTTSLAGLRMKWERHGEFSSYTFLLNTPIAETEPFVNSAASLLPAQWLPSIPGQTISAADLILLPASDDDLNGENLSVFFGDNTPVGSSIYEGAATAYTDFKLHLDGVARFVIRNKRLTDRQAGVCMQRLFEIEAYRNLALLALPIARRQSPRILNIEKSLAQLTDGIAKDSGEDELLLHELTRLAAEVESGLAGSQFRFGACRAYFELVSDRIRELREERVGGLQTIGEFMGRRFTPAVSTCNTVSQRLIALSERVAQASSLLSTRVEITRERQNSKLLSSMDRRAKMQLRLQQTVEGLSIAAIVYYMAGLFSYILKAFKAGGLPINPDLALGILIPLVAIAVFWGVRRARHEIVNSDQISIR